MSALHVIPDEIYHFFLFVHYFELYLYELFCNHGGHLGLHRSGRPVDVKTGFHATGNIICIKIVKITPIEANIWQSVQF